MCILNIFAHQKHFSFTRFDFLFKDLMDLECHLNELIQKFHYFDKIIKKIFYIYELKYKSVAFCESLK